MENSHYGSSFIGFAVVLMFLLVSSVVAQSTATAIWGNVTIGTANATGAVMEAFVGSNSSSAATITVGSQGPGVSTGYYQIDFECQNQTSFVKVWGINGTAKGCILGGRTEANISVSLVSNEGACSYGNACSSGFCCSSSTAINTSGGSGKCQPVACGAGITVPAYSLSATSITTAGTVNFTVNISNQLVNNITVANFTLRSPSGTFITRNFTIPSNSRDQNVSYKIFAANETATTGTYNITAIRVTDNGSIVNTTAIVGMNFTVTAVPATPAPDGGGGGGGGASGGSGGAAGGGAATTAPAAPSQETVDIVKGSLPASFTAPGADVEYKTVSAPETKEVPVAASEVSSVLSQVETVVKTDEAKQAVAAIQEAVSSGGSSGVSVKKSIEVVKATNKATGASVTVSVIKLSVEAKDADLKNVEVVEVIPKAVASDVKQVTFTGEKPVVLQADPVVQWSFSEVKKGQSKDLSYTVNKDVGTLSTTTVAVSEKAAAPAESEQPPTPPSEAGAEGGTVSSEQAGKPAGITGAIVAGLVILLGVAGWLFVKRRPAKK